MLKKLKGFTLIELLIVIAIIAILTVAFLPMLRGGQAKARDAARKAGVSALSVAIESLTSIPRHADSSAAGICLNFAAGPGSTIKAALTAPPKVQADGVTLCSGGYYYRTYQDETPVNSAVIVPNHYVIAVQVEGSDQGNITDGNLTITAYDTIVKVDGKFDVFANIGAKMAQPGLIPIFVMSK